MSVRLNISMRKSKLEDEMWMSAPSKICTLQQLYLGKEDIECG